MRFKLAASIFFVFIFSRQVYAQITNDECSTAITISTLPFQIAQNTRLASPNNSDPGLSCQDSIKNGKTVWFKYTADTSRFVLFNTVGSQPVADYDIIMALFVGTCGNLSEIKCNDDTLDTRQSAIAMNVTAGTTYYIMIGEWGGGGTDGGIPTGGDLLLTVSALQLPPLVRGPKSGFVKFGIVTTTDNFPVSSEAPSFRLKNEKPNRNERIEKLPPPKNMIAPSGLYGSNYFEDQSLQLHSSPIGRPVAVKNFEGIPQTNYIPPDPILAVGPNHVMVAVNSMFRIFDKDGNILKTIDSDQWFNQVLTGADTFDPILMYDHFDQRWIYVMLHVDDVQKKAFILLGVSDDNNPLGTWYNWALPAHMIGDSVVSNWTDYARVGFDKDAIYITGNQYGFFSDFVYSKVRIIPKSQLYQNNAQIIFYKDFWDFRDPDNLYTVISGLRPSITFGNPGKQFLLNDSPYFLGNFFTLWTLDNALTNPTISGTNVPVVQYFPSQDADQLEGSSIPIEAFGADVRNEPIYKDSALWAVHSVASGTEKKYSSVRYLKFDPILKKTNEDVTFGLEGFWHSYPALMVNNIGDMTITYSRSGIDEYIGAFMTGRKKNDPPGLAPSIALREGRGNYVVDFRSGRNRWGDYNGIALDPTDGFSIWTHTEFAAAKNTWGTWVAKTQLGPVAGSKLTADRTFVNFGSKSIGSSSDTISITITNDGIEPLLLSSLSSTSGQFKIVSPLLFPITIPSLGNYILQICFLPTINGFIKDSIQYCAAQSCITTNTLTILTGTGFKILPAQIGTMYAVSDSIDGSRLFSINTSTGSTSFIGFTGLGSIATMRVHPSTKELIGLHPTGGFNGAALYRISNSGISSNKILNLNLADLKGMTFINDSLMYIADIKGKIYKVNINTGTFIQIVSTGFRIGGLALHPINGSLWFCLRATAGMLDGIYKYHFATNTTELVGQTGLGIANNDLLFDKNGKLYVLAGVSITQNKLLVIDTTNGIAKQIFDLKKTNISSISLNPDAVAEISNGESQIPAQWSLQQNYPNPFNSLTVIQYSMPHSAFVKLIVYDALGRVVQTLAEGSRTAGYHKEYFDASGLASGIYYYRLSSGNFVESKKMILLR